MCACSLACESPLDARVKSALLADTLTLVGLPAVPPPGQDLAANNNSLRMRIGAVRLDSLLYVLSNGSHTLQVHSLL